MLNPAFCPEWDGNHVWIQWAGPASVGIRVRYKTGSDPWRKWIDIGKPWPLTGRSFKLPTHREGDSMQVQVGGVPDSAAWEMACVSAFQRVRASFQAHCERPYKLSPGIPVAAVVGQDVAAFVPPADMVLPAGDSPMFVMESAQSSPFNQLWEPGAFTAAPQQGVLIQNVMPSSPTALLATNATEGVVAFRKADGPVAVVLGGRRVAMLQAPQ